MDYNESILKRSFRPHLTILSIFHVKFQACVARVYVCNCRVFCCFPPQEIVKCQDICIYTKCFVNLQAVSSLFASSTIRTRSAMTTASHGSAWVPAGFRSPRPSASSHPSAHSSSICEGIFYNCMARLCPLPLPARGTLAQRNSPGSRVVRTLSRLRIEVFCV